MDPARAGYIFTDEVLKSFLSFVEPHSTIYLHLEGENLGRHGTITLATILIYPAKVLGVIDVLRLGESPFDIHTSDGVSLRSILEDPAVTKYVWDVRRGVDALWAHWRVQLASVWDIQLLEALSHPDGVGLHNSMLSGLILAAQRDLDLAPAERERWLRTEREVRGLMPQGVFSRRPVRPEVLRHCVQNVIPLPGLWEYYLERTSADAFHAAKFFSIRRVNDPCSPGYQPQALDEMSVPWRDRIHLRS